MKNWILRLLPSVAAVGLAAILAHFIFHTPPDLMGVAAALPQQFAGDWNFPVDAAMGLLTAVVLWFAASGVGHLALYRTEATGCLPTLWSRWVFAPLVGWVILSLAVFGVGLAGFAVRWALGSLMIIFSMAAVRGWSFLAADLRADLEQDLAAQAGEEFAGGEIPEPEPSAPPVVGGFHFTGLAFLLVAGIYLFIVPYALTPAVESDELRYHLAAPAQWLQAGRIQYIPNQAFSNFPFLVEMLYMMAMSLQGSEGARLVHLTFLESSGILVALLSYLLIRFSARRASPSRKDTAQNIAGLAGLGFVLIPCATILAAWAFIDLAMSAYFLAVVYLAALALVGPMRPPVWLLGMMIGGALGTKYSMAPLMVAMLTLLLMLGRYRGRRPWRGDMQVNFKYVFSAGVTGLAVAAPWFLKNIAWTGNPFYPLAHGIFGGGDWSEANAAFYAAKAAEKGLRAGEMYNMAAEHGWLLPILRQAGWDRAIELALSPLTTSLFPDYFEGHFLGPLPLSAMLLAALGGIFAFVRRGMEPGRDRGTIITRHARAVLAMWVPGVIAGSWLFWFLTYQSNRMLLPTLGLVLAAGAWGFARLSDSFGLLPAPRAIRAILLAGMLYAFLYTACGLLGSAPREVKLVDHTWFLGSARFGHPLPVAWGEEAPEHYIERRLEYAAAARWMSEKLSPEKRALLIGEHRTMWFDGPVVASDWFDTPQPLPLIRATKTNDELFEALRARKIQYIFFNREELRRYAALYFVPRFTAEEFARFEALIGFSGGRPDARLQEIHKDPNFDIHVYEIVTPQ